MYELYFGYESNGKMCKYGCHHGIGDITPETRAARCAWMKDRMPGLMTQPMRDFLSDYEKRHGAVKYSIGVIGTNKKGEELKGAIYID